MIRDNVKFFNPQGGGGYHPQGGGYYGGPRRSVDTGLLIFSIVNIVLGCCGLPMILGIIALVFVLQAPKAPTYAEMASKNRTAKILNIVAIIFFVVGTVVSVLLSQVFLDMYMEILEEVLASEGVTL